MHSRHRLPASGVTWGVDDHALVLYRTVGDVRGLRRAVSLLALLPFVATAQDDSAVIEWRQDSAAEVVGFRVYYGRDPRSLSGMHQVLDPAARITSVDGLAEGTWYFEIRAVSSSAVESEASSRTCVVIPSGSCDVPLDAESRTRNPAVTAAPTPEVRATISNIDPRNSGFDLSIEGKGSVTIALAGELLFDWCGPAVPTTPSLGDKDDDGNRRQTVTFAAPLARTRCDGDAADGNAAFSGATATLRGVSKPFVESNGTWSVRFP
jgi:hypothetical protein